MFFTLIPEQFEKTGSLAPASREMDDFCAVQLLQELPQLVCLKVPCQRYGSTAEMKARLTYF